MTDADLTALDQSLAALMEVVPSVLAGLARQDHEAAAHP
jgi:hypothetical protein